MPKSGTPSPASAASAPVLSDEEIYQRLIEAIVDQRLLPGTKLVEDKLGQAFGVSRTRIRQVLIRLAQEQVVTLQPNKGASVAEPTVEEAREVFEARTVVETVLVQRFVARATPKDLKALADCIAAEDEARRTGDKTMALRLSGQFHLLLADTAAHQTFAKFLHKLVSRTSLILMSYTPVERLQVAGSELPQRWVQACRCEEHRGLLTALRAATQGKATTDQAVRLMAEHLAHIEASLSFTQAEPAGVDVVQALALAKPRRQRASRAP
ncbi:MAG: GntR family transcriptional regulator [Rubrivivax sp.]|nr:MAG: GntR family transcriptional regulator [Rubrivivax sp.]